MKSFKPTYLKTYGKRQRKLSAWISPNSHKRAFDSTSSTDGDNSDFEPVKPKRTRWKSSDASSRVLRPAKKKAMRHLTEISCNKESISNEENGIIHSPPRPAQQSKAKRGKKTSVSSGKAVHPAKRKAIFSQTENSSDENISRPSPHQHQPAQQGKTNSVCPPSVGRFVTRRRRAASKPLPKAVVSILNSSDDFTSGAFGTSRILHPNRIKRVPLSLVSSAENSVNAVGTSGFATNLLREISLNEMTEHSLGPCPRKPVFCSTPSAGSFSKRQRLKHSHINDQPFTPSSVSLSCISVLSSFQEDLDSRVHFTSPPILAQPTGLRSEEKTQSSHGEQEPDMHHHKDASGGLFTNPQSVNKSLSNSEEAKSYSEDTKPKSYGRLPSPNLLSTDSESSSRFLSATEALEWLMEALKDKCLTEPCTVQLDRLDNLTVSQLCHQTTYSSCLGSLCGGRPFELLQSSEASFNLHLSVTNNNSSHYLQSLNSLHSPEQAASVTDSQSSNNSPSVGYKQSAEHSRAREFTEQSVAVFSDESTHHTESSVQQFMGTQLPAKSASQAIFTKESVALKDKCLAEKCTIQLKKLSLPQVTVRQHKGPTQQRGACLNCDDTSVNPNANNPEDLTHSGEITGRMMASVRQSLYKTSAVAQAQASDPETKEKAAVLKEKCLADKCAVEIKRVNLLQVKEVLKLKNTKLKSASVMSDSASDDQRNDNHRSESDTKDNHRSESDTKDNHRSESDTKDNHRSESDTKDASVKKKSSASSKNNVASDKAVVKNSFDILPKTKKMSLAPKEKKRRNTSADRPGMTRKACVSGLSVSRWKNKGSTSARMFTGRTARTGDSKAVDWSINELVSTHRKQPKERGATKELSTPVKASQLNLSSLLADFTPNTHTWSRLKAALSVHRKGIVLHTPRALSMSGSLSREDLADISQDLFATPVRTSLPKHLQSQLLGSVSLAVYKDADLSDAEKVYAECGQQHPLPWEECILPQQMKRCVKIGEGSFGEVFSTTNTSGDTVAFKIIPVEGSEKVNGEDQKTFGEILHEIIISKELSSLKEKSQNQTHGFIGLDDLHCVQGCYPSDFLKAWDRFDRQKVSENDRPDFFEKDQIFIILEFEFGGTDLENSNGTLASLGVAKSILHQVTAALAVAEQELHFEHRDLHWGNVLVRPTKQKTGTFLLNGTTHSLETKGVLVRIIDYSLSRLEIDELTVSCDISKDEQLFMGQGDYQFEIYRLMRKENGNNWSEYHPHSNVLWLHYLCSKLLSMKYRGLRRRGTKDVREELTRFYDNILECSSATEALQNCAMFH